MEQHEFREIGQRLYGDKWFKRMAHELGVTVHTVRAMANDPTRKVTSYLAKSIKNLDRLGDDFTRKTMERMNAFLDRELGPQVDEDYGCSLELPPQGRPYSFTLEGIKLSDNCHFTNDGMIKCNQPESEDTTNGDE